MQYTLLQQAARHLARSERLNRQARVLFVFTWLAAAVAVAVAVYSNW